MKLLILAASAASMTSAVDRGDYDEAARQGALAGPAVVEEALAAPARSTQLAAILAAPSTEDRAELLPALARLAGGPDRRVAIPAARAARTIARELAAHELPDDLAPDDIATWRGQFAALARGERFIEVRVLALDTASSLAHVIAPDDIGFDLAATLADPDPAVRAAAIAVVPRPTPPAARAVLAAATGDADARVALAAAAALCGDLLFDDPAPVLAALGPQGLDRVRALAAKDRTATGREAARCLRK